MLKCVCSCNMNISYQYDIFVQSKEVACDIISAFTLDICPLRRVLVIGSFMFRKIHVQNFKSVRNKPYRYFILLRFV